MSNTILRAAAALAFAGALLAGPAAAEPVKRAHDGLTVNGELTLAPGKTAADGVVLLVHGTLAHHAMELIKTLQERFAERGVNTLAVTLSLGVNDRAGMYDCAVPHRHRQEDAAAEIAGWVDWLKGRGFQKVTVFGHSRGGNQVGAYAAAAPDAVVERIVLLAPSTDGSDNAAAMVKQADGKEDAALLDVPAFLYCGPTKATAAALRSYYGDPARFDTPALLARIDRPVLVIAGGADTVVPRLPSRMKEVEGQHKARFTLVEGADHFFQDLFADDVADAVLSFLGAKP